MSIDGSPFRYLAEVCAASKIDVRAVHLTYQCFSKKIPFHFHSKLKIMSMELLFAI